MKKTVLSYLLRNVCFALLASVLVFSGCKKPEPDEPTKPGAATLRYETVPYAKSVKSGELDNLVFYDCDEEYNYYYFVLGYVRSAPLGYRDAYYYNGLTSLTIKYSRSDITQESIKSSVNQASGYSTTNTHSTNYSNEIGGKLGLGSQSSWIKFEASYKLSWGGSDGTSETNSRSFSNTYETSLQNTSSTTTEESYVIGNKGEPAGMYRWSLFSTTDVYFVVVTDRAKTEIIDAYAAYCARQSQYWKIDYDPEEGGTFGKTATGTLLEIPEIILSQLPNPSENPELPILITNAVTDVGATTAILGGNIINAGIPRYTERGVVYSTMSNPTIADHKTIIAGSGTGDFSTNVTGFAEGTQYYVRAYATNTEGTAYGEQVSFITLDPGRQYIDENGILQTLPSNINLVNYTGQNLLGVSGTTAWFFVKGSQTANERITINGDVHVILADGCTLDANNGGIYVTGSNRLTIYAQSVGTAMGVLTAKGSTRNAGIGGNTSEPNGFVTINGGRINANGANGSGRDAGGAGIGGGGGSHDGTHDRGGDGGSITVNGGTVTATGGDAGKGGNGGSSSGNGGGGGGAGIGGGGGCGRTQAWGGDVGGDGGIITVNNRGTVIATSGKFGSGGTGGGLWGAGGGGGGAGAAIGGGGGGGAGGRGAGALGSGEAGSNGSNSDLIGSGGNGGKGGGSGVGGGINGGAGGNGGTYTNNGGTVTPH